MLKNRIKQYREKMGMSQVELARRAKIASPNLSAVERGQLMPWPKIKKTLARELKTSVEELFPENGEYDGK